MRGAGGALAFGGLANFLSACGTGTTAPSGGSSGTAIDSLVVASSLAGTVFDPNLSATALTVWPVLYDSLFDTSTPPKLADATAYLKDFDPKPALATTWEASEDQLEWTLTLNTAITSPHGNKFSSADVLWSFERNLDMKWYSGIFLNRIGITDIKQVTAPDAKTIKLSLPQVVARNYFLQLLGSFVVPIYDSVEAKKHATSTDKWASDWISKNACGFGPYTLKSVNSDGSAVEFEANPHYWGEKPFDTVTWRQTTESNTQLQMLLKGKAHIIDALSPTQVQAVESSSAAKVTSVTTTGFVFIGFDNSKAPFKDVALHQGIAYALPFDEIVSSVYKGQATAMKSVISSFLQGATDEYWNYTQDLDKATSLLAPYAGESITLQYKSGDNSLKTIAILIQSSLKAVGLNIQLEAMDPNSFQTKLTAAELTMWLDNQSTPLVPDSLYALQLLFPSEPTQVLIHYSNSIVDKAIAGLATAKTTEEQNAFIKQAQKVLVEELPIVPLAQLPYISPTAEAITNIRGHGASFMWIKDLETT
ncbi:MAG: ABC transporter substrate-binding protein [Nocardioides sp.]|uniref:ABC transporter substrate-binding protein n=1 Tax=Nocardioides sp. TaxID=35761 RepID=UPI0039E37B69